MLFVYMKEHSYDDELPLLMIGKYLIMTEKFEQMNKYCSFGSIICGKYRITGCFTILGVDYLAAYQSHHQHGAGNHCF